MNQLGGKKKKWKKLVHQGLLIQRPYEKHNIPIIYDNNKEIIIKNPILEEYFTLYAKASDTY